MFTFGDRLKELRKTHNITQKQLAVLTQTSERGIQNYESSLRNPSFEALLAFADYFNVSIDYLVGRSNDPTRHP